MRLAEALKRRADLQAMIAETTGRVTMNAKVQEGDAPGEDPQELMDRVEAMNDELAALIVSVNLTNTTTTDDDGRTITELIGERERLRNLRKLVMSWAAAGQLRSNRFGRDEIKWTAVIDSRALFARADALRVELTALDSKLQRLNWTTELDGD